MGAMAYLVFDTGKSIRCHNSMGTLVNDPIMSMKNYGVRGETLHMQVFVVKGHYA